MMNLTRYLVCAIVAMLSLNVHAHAPANKTAEPTEHGTKLNPPRDMQDFNLHDHQGQVMKLASFSGKWTLVFFGFSRCSQVCPTTLAHLNREVKDIPNWQKHINVAFITVDPDRDTPQRLMEYVQTFNPHFTGLYGDMNEIEKVAKDFGAYFKHQPDMPQEVDDILHSSYIYLLNPETKWHTLYRTPLKKGVIEQDLRRLVSALEAG